MADPTGGARLRAEAARAVDAVAHRGRSLDAALEDAERALAPDARPLLRAVCYGTLRHHWRLLAQVRTFLNRPLKARDRIIESLLAVGIFQLTDLRVANHAAVSLTVEAARLLKRPTMKSLVNAVLRNFLRSPPSFGDDAPEEVRYDHPRWLIERLRADWPEHWPAVLAANNRPAPMWLRVNRQRLTAAAWREALAASRGAAADEVGSLHAGLDQAVRLEKPCPVERLPGFADGDVSVQDGAAQLAAPWLLAGHAGGRILDACAAPGGKSAHLAELAGPDAALTAIDADPERAALVSETLARLGLRATVLAADASKPQDWWDSETYDRILLDAPCSATGVIRRHPDIKHLRRAADVTALAETQAALLEALWTMLAPSGRLLYVTCSVLRAENDDVIAAFKARHADARENNVLPNNNIHDVMYRTPHGFQILPGTSGLDGFYFACLDKRP